MSVSPFGDSGSGVETPLADANEPLPKRRKASATVQRSFREFLQPAPAAPPHIPSRPHIPPLAALIQPVDITATAIIALQPVDGTSDDEVPFLVYSFTHRLRWLLASCHAAVRAFH
jgi:hypothetical protein